MAPLLSVPLLRTQSDSRLAALAADGHDRAFEAIVERYRGPLQRYLRRLLSEALAEDVLQASFVRAWQALRSGTEVRDLRPWLYRIAHNQALNTLRAAGAALPTDGAELPAVSLEAEVERREALRETLSGIEALPERQRAALVAIAVAGRSHADVARELGMSDGALRQLLLRARTTLRAAATALTPYPLMSWLAGGQEVTAARVAELAAGAGGAGVAIKAGAAVLAAGAVVAGPALRAEHQPARAKAESATEQPARGAAPVRAALVSSPTPSPDHEAGDQGGPLDDQAGQDQGASSGEHSGDRHGRRHSGSHGSGSGGSGSSGSGDGSGKSDEGDDDEGSGHGGSGKSGSPESGKSDDEGGSSASGSGDTGSGESGSGESGSGESGSGDDGGGSGSGISGGSGSLESASGRRESGAAEETQLTPTTPVPGADAPAATPLPVSGEGSGSSGSGHGGSGDD
jgi:RNA polymerase sigma factor (sigma-70 family)